MFTLFICYVFTGLRFSCLTFFVVFRISCFAVFMFSVFHVLCFSCIRFSWFAFFMFFRFSYFPFFTFYAFHFSVFHVFRSSCRPTFVFIFRQSCLLHSSSFLRFIYFFFYIFRCSGRYAFCFQWIIVLMLQVLNFCLVRVHGAWISQKFTTSVFHDLVIIFFTILIFGKSSFILEFTFSNVLFKYCVFDPKCCS